MKQICIILFLSVFSLTFTMSVGQPLEKEWLVDQRTTLAQSVSKNVIIAEQSETISSEVIENLPRNLEQHTHSIPWRPTEEDFKLVLNEHITRAHIPSPYISFGSLDSLGVSRLSFLPLQPDETDFLLEFGSYIPDASRAKMIVSTGAKMVVRSNIRGRVNYVFIKEELSLLEYPPPDFVFSTEIPSLSRWLMELLMVEFTGFNNADDRLKILGIMSTLGRKGSLTVTYDFISFSGSGTASGIGFEMLMSIPHYEIERSDALLRFLGQKLRNEPLGNSTEND